MCGPVALLFIIRSFQIEPGGGSEGCQNLLPSLLEVLWVKDNETSVMGGTSAITPMTHSPSSTAAPARLPRFSSNILQQNQVSSLQLSLVFNCTRDRPPRQIPNQRDSESPNFIAGFGTRYCLSILNTAVNIFS